MGCNKYNACFLHTFNENVIATDIKLMIIATEGHGITRTISVNIRDAPMQKQPTQYCYSNGQQTKYDSNGMARNNTDLSLTRNIFNNE